MKTQSANIVPAILNHGKWIFLSRLLFIFFLHLLPLCTFSQSGYNNYEDALYVSKFDEYKSLADSLLNVEIAKGSKKFEIYLLKSKLLYEKEKSLEGFPYLLKAVQYGCDFQHHIFTNSFFKKHISETDSLQIVRFAEKHVEIPFETANKLALVRLLELVNWDQAVTWFWIKNHDSIGLNVTQYRTKHNTMINELLQDYLEEFGFPDEQEFGSDLVDRFRIVIIHQESREWFMPFYEEAFKQNKLSPECYYEFKDWVLVDKDLPQTYGAYNNGQLRNGKYYGFPIENLTIVDSLRKSANLTPLHVFLKNNNFEIPEGYRFDLAEYIQTVRNKIGKP